MTDLRAQQEPFFTYLTGYVAFYLGDFKNALADLEKAQQDPFIQCLIGQVYEKLGDKDKAMDYYRKAVGTRGHNPPAAYAVPFAKKKLRLASLETVESALRGGSFAGCLTMLISAMAVHFLHKPILGVANGSLA